MTLEERVAALEEALAEVLRLLARLTDVAPPTPEDRHKDFARRVREKR